MMFQAHSLTINDPYEGSHTCLMTEQRTTPREKFNRRFIADLFLYEGINEIRVGAIECDQSNDHQHGDDTNHGDDIYRSDDPPPSKGPHHVDFPKHLDDRDHSIDANHSLPIYDIDDLHRSSENYPPIDQQHLITKYLDINADTLQEMLQRSLNREL